MGGVYYFDDNYGNRQTIYKLKPKIWKTTLDESLSFDSCKECYEFLVDNGFTKEKCFETEQYKRNRLEIIRIANKCAIDNSITDFEVSIVKGEVLLIFYSKNNMFSFKYYKNGVSKPDDILYTGKHNKLINFIKTIESIRKAIKTYSILFDGIVLIYKSAVRAA